jgi:hypothetical protein
MDKNTKFISLIIEGKDEIKILVYSWFWLIHCRIGKFMFDSINELKEGNKSTNIMARNKQNSLILRFLRRKSAKAIVSAVAHIIYQIFYKKMRLFATVL